MNKIHGYSKIYNLGHGAVEHIFDSEVVLQEKLDGSQFSWTLVEEESKLVLKARSHHREINLDAPDNMFQKAIESIKALEPHLTVGWTYRAEYMRKPKANTLAYDRTPKLYLAVFDIDAGEEKYLSPTDVKAECDRLGLEIVPTFFVGKVEDIETLKSLLETTSFLGGQKIEGVVAKNYSKIDEKTGKTLMAKHVSEKFRELNHKDFKDRNPSSKGVLETIIAEVKSEARWQKAYQHLLERGKISHEPKDIGLLIRELNKDTLEELEQHIKDRLFKWAWKDISRAIGRGFPEWYKNLLMERQFDKGVTNEATS